MSRWLLRNTRGLPKSKVSTPDTEKRDVFLIICASFGAIRFCRSSTVDKRLAATLNHTPAINSAAPRHILSHIGNRHIAIVSISSRSCFRRCNTPGASAFEKGLISAKGSSDWLSKIPSYCCRDEARAYCAVAESFLALRAAAQTPFRDQKWKLQVHFYDLGAARC